ncbi:MAG: S-layer homology domain-containing protein [Peptoanaerobacter stomatis]|uniref:S-layer homology domain-containing protein n=1 Tax=Peptoanaerobacter stomatis TaxID=796937 RepID=UPI003F9F0569
MTFDIVKKSGGGTIPGGQSGGGSSGGGSPGGGGTSGDVTPKNNDITKDNKQEKNKAENKVDDKKSDIKKFDDVNKDDWYYDSVIFVSKNGYMTGISENKFAPMMSTSRAMISQIIYNLEKTPKTAAKHNFTDVAKNVWYEQSLNFTFDKDIVAGFPDKTFRGNSIITREQLTKILYQYAIYKGYNSDTDTDMSKYEDFEKAGDWSKISIKWAVKHNIIKGRTSTSLDPKSELTRAELAAVLKNFHSEFVK